MDDYVTNTPEWISWMEQIIKKPLFFTESRASTVTRTLSKLANMKMCGNVGQIKELQVPFEASRDTASNASFNHNPIDNCRCELYQHQNSTFSLPFEYLMWWQGPAAMREKSATATIQTATFLGTWQRRAMNIATPTSQQKSPAFPFAANLIQRARYLKASTSK